MSDEKRKAQSKVVKMLLPWNQIVSWLNQLESVRKNAA